MKTIAFYLPQFHKTKENDAWWGEGYTEWTAVKKAVPLFPNHHQPKIPFEKNYYNLLDKKTMEWQQKIMAEYGIDGFCFYHYYFGKDRMLLEKPAENLLNWKDVNMPFCFSWANETWARTWSNVQGKNVWNSNEEGEKTGNGILMKQQYGQKEEWIRHFQYLLPFFKDARYLKEGQSPIFLIHKPDLITCLPQMMETWNELARLNGFDGIYFIGSNTSMEGLDGYVRQEANYSDVYNQLCVDYSDICQTVIQNALTADSKTFLCGFPGYDDTPRRGSGGKVIANSSPQKFEELMTSLYLLSKKRGLDYLFINAWNEWGEGMYLEPDEEYGYGYLEALKRAQNVNGYENKEIEINEPEIAWDIIRKQQTLVSKSKDSIRVLSKMLAFSDLKNALNQYLKRKNIESIAIYGIGDIANAFLPYVSDKVSYLIDKRPDNINLGYKVYKPDGQLPKVDMVVVCVPLYFVSVYVELRKNIDFNVTSIEEVLNEAGKNNEP